MRAARQIAAVLSALGAYLSTALPPLRGELRRWRAAAGRIQDQELRGLALAALAEKSANVEAVAVFATLAPLRHRKSALRAIAALQISVDYLDSVEEAGYGPAELEDDGYLSELRGFRQAGIDVLPAATATRDLIDRAIRRSGEGQAHTHAAEHGDQAAAESWARQLPSPVGYRWWELAAGASSSVAAHALIAAAADPTTTRRQAELIDAAYNPSIGALTVLLDNLVDREQDAATGSHNYFDYYAGADDAAARIARMTQDGSMAIARLPKSDRHRAILAGVAGFYLSDPGALGPFADAIHARLKPMLGSSVALVEATMTARRRL